MNSNQNPSSENTGLKLTLGPTVNSEILGDIPTPEWIIANGIKFVWDEPNGWYPSEDESCFLYTEDEILTEDSYWEIATDPDSVPNSN